MNRLFARMGAVVMGLAVVVSSAMPRTASACPAAPATAGADVELWPTLPPPPASRVIMVDGRAVTVTISMTRYIPMSILGLPSFAWTGVSVGLSVNDGAQLPSGIVATRVRFEKLRGNNRVFGVNLTEDQVIGGGGAENGTEADSRSYSATVSDQTARITRVKATVRLRIDGELRTVPFGIISIYQASSIS